MIDRWTLISIILLLGGVACGPAGAPTKPSVAQRATPGAQGVEPSEDSVASLSYEEAIEAIARDIKELAGEFPQLREFSPGEHCDVEGLTISYGHKTHDPTGRGGWTAAVPNPDPDGIWFHIDFHPPDSTRQIHTQPVVLDRRYKDKKVMFLILEGEQTAKVSARLDEIMTTHGVTAPR